MKVSDYIADFLHAQGVTHVFELVGGMVASDRLGRIEDAEVAPDDLVGAVALDPLGAAVPRGDQPLRVEQEDRVVLYVVDQ